jgi:hypothetical protein
MTGSAVARWTVQRKIIDARGGGGQTPVTLL